MKPLKNQPFVPLGDIQELYETNLAPGHAAAFSDDCDLPSTHEMVRSVGMQVRRFCHTQIHLLIFSASSVSKDCNVRCCLYAG